MQLNLRVVLGHLLYQQVAQLEYLLSPLPFALPLLEQPLQAILVAHEEQHLHD